MEKISSHTIWLRRHLREYLRNILCSRRLIRHLRLSLLRSLNAARQHDKHR